MKFDPKPPNFMQACRAKRRGQVEPDPSRATIGFGHVVTDQVSFSAYFDAVHMQHDIIRERPARQPQLPVIYGKYINGTHRGTGRVRNVHWTPHGP